MKWKLGVYRGRPSAALSPERTTLRVQCLGFRTLEGVPHCAPVPGQHHGSPAEATIPLPKLACFQGAANLPFKGLGNTMGTGNYLIVIVIIIGIVIILVGERVLVIVILFVIVRVIGIEGL